VEIEQADPGDVAADAPDDAAPEVGIDLGGGDIVDVPLDGQPDGPVPDVPSDSASDGSGSDLGGVDVPPSDASDAVLEDGSCVETGEEVCDGLDNDCNGVIDDPPVCDESPCGASMAVIDRGDGTTFCIDAYEASRPDATADSPGSASTEATSRAGVLPWSELSFEQAGAACGAAGKRLCSAFEWQSACQGPALSLYPYGNSYTSDACNGSNTPPLDRPSPTGAFAGCASSEGTFDQSGNLAEWTTDQILRGGSFEAPQLNLRCSSRATPSAGVPTAEYGFRCCKDGP